MRLLFIGPNLGAGGAERQWAILLPGLRRLGHDARLVALDAGGPFQAPLEQAGVPLEVLDMRHQADVLPLGRSPMLRRFRPDVVVSRGVSGLWVGQLAATLRGARHVFNEHRQVGLELSPRRELMTRLLARRLDLVVAVTADQIPAWIERGVRADQVVVIENGVPAPAVVTAKDDIRAELGIAPSSIVVVLVAAMRREKRIGDFITGLRSARRSRPELLGIVVGDGPDRDAVEMAARGDDGIRLLGFRDDVPRLLQAADVFALTSEYEAAPMAILEAMASGLPVVATDVGGIGAIVADGESGILITPRDTRALADALARLAGSPQLRRQMGLAGAARHRRRWDAELMIGRYADVFDQMNHGASTAVRS